MFYGVTLMPLSTIFNGRWKTKNKCTEIKYEGFLDPSS